MLDKYLFKRHYFLILQQNSQSVVQKKALSTLISSTRNTVICNANNFMLSEAFNTTKENPQNSRLIFVGNVSLG